ncbi:uncharacterized protein A4U43_C02F3170 [Asparagus officinalis]|uniref:Pentacotripeptide-repeat region of PRORP domain-containing protein n=1 Tax=Asparagus officinalis TaxID=4686 RepID=A0A5P1FI68_ASPOF|nr:pentatricopeptide repeat-containing protein At3g54980, mitochondrial [Asparagus officinalis]XP_020252755.1 pentatricopeptide repeat-containing protein At3g54980, mitochondrial [Asparagus officinalis]XP_020252756.1 pentatricopeptide repeat-containing protein At3g54980, mitochondrial [Asparagus officinalis]ONK77107.1 uncharacterized protein A4U43_C02F3170 [Asparagus officinalis]
MRIVRSSSSPLYQRRPRFAQNTARPGCSASSNAVSLDQFRNLTALFVKKPPIREHQVTQFLLSNQRNPKTALRYFKSAVKDGFFALDPFCILLHILIRSGRLSSARELLKDSLLSDSSPEPSDVVDKLVETSKRCDFDFSHPRSFDSVLVCYARAGRVDNALLVYDLMVRNGVIPGIRARNYLLSTLLRSDFNERGWELYEGMKGKGMGFDCCSFSILMQACLKKDELEEVEALFRDMIDRGLKPDRIAYSTLIQAVCRKPDSKRACELLWGMKKVGLVPRGFVYTWVIGACVKQGNMEDALRVKDDMVEDTATPLNLVAATSLIKGHIDQGDLESALSLLATVAGQGIAPNNITYSIVLEGCCRMGNPDKAYEVYCQMRKGGLHPDAYVMSSLMQCFLSSNRQKQAFALFDEAVDLATADVFHYNILMHWLCKEGRLKEACDLWVKMEGKGLKPNIFSYNHLLFGYCKQGDMNAADNLFKQLLKSSIQPNSISYTNLVDGYIKKKDFDRACDIMNEMQERGVSCNDHTFNSFINGLCKAGRMSDLNEVLHQFKEQGFVPSCRTYNSIIHGFIKEGDMTSAVSVLHEMGKVGISPDVVTYASLIDGYGRNNCPDLALKLWNKVRRKGLQMDTVVYTTVIVWLCKEGKMEAALGLLDEMPKVGLAPNAVIFNSLFAAYKEANNMDAAFDLHRRMCKEGIPCDTATYTTLIDGALKVGNLIFASELYSEMLENSIVPDAITYAALTRGLCIKGDLENARKVLEDMNVRPNALIYNMLIACYFREGNVQEAFRLHDEMLDRGLVPDDKTYDILVSMEYGGNESFEGT